MKIDASKNHSVERKEPKNVFQTESNVFNTSNPLKPAVGTPPTESVFAKILEETRKQNDKDNSPAAKTDAADSDSKTAKAEKDEKLSRAADEKKELEERDSKSGDGDARHSGDENQTATGASAGLQSPSGDAADVSAPAARSILHVADLERIVSTIRTENFQNQKQVTIALKNSVLQGLQIKLTINENGRLKAEFLALNRQIKKHLDRRKNELSEILKNRSALFSEVEIKTQE